MPRSVVSVSSCSAQVASCSRRAASAVRAAWSASAAMADGDLGEGGLGAGDVGGDLLPKSASANRRDRLAALIKQASKDSDETYGYRGVHAQLARWGVSCGPELVRGITRELDLHPCQPRPWRLNLTEAGGREHRIHDLLGQDFTADAPGQKTVGDITYIPTWEGWLIW